MSNRQMVVFFITDLGEISKMHKTWFKLCICKISKHKKQQIQLNRLVPLK